MSKLLVLAFLILVECLTSARADKRVALIIGNGNYQNIDKLANPVTDSRAMKVALGKLGFEIIYGENLHKRELERTIGQFAYAARSADVALVYYAGHGATFGDTPYLVPIDAHFTSVEEMPYELVPVEAMVSELRRAKGLRIAILDACRDNAAEHDLKRIALRGGAITRGLAPPQNPDGMIIAYATQYLSTAADGDPSGDSPFTAALLQYLPTPGMDVKTMFFKVGQEVINQTKGAQRPEIKISFFEDYVLAEKGKVEASATQTNLEQGEFNLAMRADTPTAIDAYLAKYSSGALVEIARRERRRLLMAAALPPLKPPENLNKKILTPAKTTLLECKFKTRLILGVVLIPDRSILRMAYGDGGVQEWTNVTFTADKILALSSVMSPDRTVIITQNLKKIVFTDRGANEISNGTCQSVPITKGEEYWFADVLKQNWEN